MYHSLDTPKAVKQIQQKIWLSKSIEQRLVLSLQMIDDARLLQIQGLKIRFPNWSDEEIRLYRLKRLLKNYPSLTWLKPIIE